MGANYTARAAFVMTDLVLKPDPNANDDEFISCIMQAELWAAFSTA